MKVLYTKDHFQKAKEVTWDDVIKKIDNENELKTLRTLIGSTARMTGSDSDAPSIICHNQNLPLTIFNAFQEVSQSFKVQSCHLYISFSSHAPTFGRHKDQVDVLRGVSPKTPERLQHTRCKTPGTTFWRVLPRFP